MRIIRPLKVLDTNLTASNVPETEYTLYSAGTTYALGDYVRVVSTNVHQIYQSLVASNVGNNPATSPTKWAYVSATNRWNMFDASVSTVTSNANSINVTLQVTGSVTDSIALMNIGASSVSITQTTVDGVTYSTTQSLTSTAGIVDWYSWTFEPIVRKTDFAVTNLPLYANSTINIVLNDTGSTVTCGACILGQKRELGETQLGAKTGIQDYSIKTRDAYGNYTILQRAFNKKCDFTFTIESGLVDAVQTLLAGYRAQPIVYMGSDDYANTMILGYYKDFSIDISYHTMSICSLQIEGLT